MGEILEPYLQVDVRRLFSLFFYQIIGLGQSFLLQPSAGGSMEDLFEIPFERSQASTGEIGKLLHLYIKGKVPRHKFLQIDLSGFAEIE